MDVGWKEGEGTDTQENPRLGTDSQVLPSAKVVSVFFLW